MKTRTTDARPGSAWDTWHKAGFEYAMNGGERDNLLAASHAYCNTKPHNSHAVTRAFREGARNFWKQK